MNTLFIYLYLSCLLSFYPLFHVSSGVSSPPEYGCGGLRGCGCVVWGVGGVCFVCVLSAKGFVGLSEGVDMAMYRCVGVSEGSDGAMYRCVEGSEGVDGAMYRCVEGSEGSDGAMYRCMRLSEGVDGAMYRCVGVIRWI